MRMTNNILDLLQLSSSVRIMHSNLAILEQPPTKNSICNILLKGELCSRKRFLKDISSHVREHK